MNEAAIRRNLTSSQQAAFDDEMDMERKNAWVGGVLNFFLGGAGAHHFYIKRVGIGALYLLATALGVGLLLVYFSQSSRIIELLAENRVAIPGNLQAMLRNVLIGLAVFPTIVSWLELPFIARRIRRYNDARAETVAIRLKTLAGADLYTQSVDSNATVMVSPKSKKEITFLGHFNVIEGPEKGKKIPIFGFPSDTGYVTTIGREKIDGEKAKAHIQLADPSVSRQQALFYCENGRYFIKNLSQTNPTQVEGKPLSDHGVALNSGVHIQMGGITLGFEA